MVTDDDYHEEEDDDDDESEALASLRKIAQTSATSPSLDRSTPAFDMPGDYIAENGDVQSKKRSQALEPDEVPDAKRPKAL